MLIRYSGSEGFVVPPPAGAGRRAKHAEIFSVVADVAADLRRVFDYKEELVYVNRRRCSDSVLRVDFKNIIIEPLEFVHGEITEVQDPYVAGQLIELRWFSEVLADEAPPPPNPETISGDEDEDEDPLGD